MPHVIDRAALPRRVVIIGAGPAGLEAARVAGERGHRVTVLEAADRAGGQINLLAANPRRRDLNGIVAWRLAELERLGVELRCNLYAEAEEVLSLSPEMVIVATGGLPQSPEMAGDTLGVSTWDILSGAVKPAGRVIVYDDNGGHPGMSAAEVIARGGSEVEVISPERFFAPEMGGMNHVPYARAFHEAGVRITINTRVTALRREGNEIVAVLGSDYAPGWSEERRADQVVVEHGTMANDGLYLDLRPASRNLGEVDYAALIGGGPLFPERNPEGRFMLYRIGDAVASRNIHAGIYDALRFGIRW
jgi:NADPH-dependent 2,4-dienoyl-CoA reductase/sulfur reductase-like enzyme